MSLIGSSVLMIDDDTELRTLVRKILVRAGITMYEAPDVKTGIQRAHKKLPQAIILDLNLKGASGFDFLQLRKKSPLLTKTPILEWSGMSEREASRKALALGAEDYLAKPVKANLLLQKIRKILRDREFHSFSFN